MERLIVLGTGNAMVTKCYNPCFAIDNSGETILVDAGEATASWRRWRKPA